MTRLTPIRAIRAKCLDCCCGQRAEVRLCPSTSCTLHPYRLGKRPVEEGYADGLPSEEVGGYLGVSETMVSERGNAHVYDERTI